MSGTKLYIKNMVCDRCKLVVRQELEKLKLSSETIQLGEVELTDSLTEPKKDQLQAALKKVGFELIDDKNSKLISQIKRVIIDLIHHGKERKPQVNYSTYLAKEIGRDYAHLSNLFSDIEGTTIEQYIIHQKVEHVKELLVYDEKNVSEIAVALGYSSVGHLSNQFKKVTGLSPSHFKTLGLEKRKPLDKV